MAIPNISGPRPGLHERIDNEDGLSELRTGEQQQRQQDRLVRDGHGDGPGGGLADDHASGSPAPRFLVPALPPTVASRETMPSPPPSRPALLNAWPTATRGISANMAVDLPRA